jgi:tetratricopeptide (TPR) repeat protein
VQTPARSGAPAWERAELAAAADRVEALDQLSGLLRRLRRRHARDHSSGPLTVRELARRSGYAYGAISEYLNSLDAYRRALASAAGTGDPYQRARAHHGLARTLAAAGDHATAARHWRPALTWYAHLGVPEAEQVRGALDQPAEPAGVR